MHLGLSGFAHTARRNTDESSSTGMARKANEVLGTHRMKPKNKNSRSWIILLMVNALVIVTPIVYCVRTTSQEASHFSAILLVAVIFIMAIADVRMSLPHH